MRNLLNRRRDECEQLQDLLESSAAHNVYSGGIEEFAEGLTADGHAHWAECGNCRQAAEDLLATRELFKGAISRAEDGGPWFAKRVLNAITAREQEMALAMSTWSAVPRFASRLAWAAALVLVVGSTWLYETSTPRTTRQPAAASSQEYLFESPAPPMNQDDVLISMAESKP